MNAKPSHAAIVLAAGASRRMGRPKQLIAWDGCALVRRAALAALATDPVRAAIVLGAHADDVFAAVADLPLQRIDCATSDEGMSASLRAGIDAVQGSGAQGVLLVLCDQVALDASHLRALCGAWRADPALACASAYAGNICVPAVLPRAWFEDLRALHGDRGARDLLRTRRALVRAIPAPDLAHDLDRPGDLSAFLAPRHQGAATTDDIPIEGATHPGR